MSPTSISAIAAWAAAHAARRDALVARLSAVLGADDRFVAAWLIGGLGRPGPPPDALSDVNLVAVVAERHVRALCARPRETAGRTTSERLEVLRRLGRPAVVHENHRNAPPGGTMTYAVYEDGAELALYLVPQSVARRPAPSRLLFERQAVPHAAPPAPEPPEERREQATASVAFFWMMAGIAARYRLRGWDWQVNRLLEMLRVHVARVRRLTAGDAPSGFRHTPPPPLAATPAAQAAAIRELCDAMEALAPAVLRLGATIPPAPRATVEARLGAALPGQTVGEPRLAGALAYLSDHLAERLTLAQLAGAAFLSPAHFSVVFKRATGLPPLRYVQRRRLERAKELLATGDLPVAAIARAAGFRDASHFHRVFRHAEGLTPGAYRTRARPPPPLAAHHRQFRTRAQVAVPAACERDDRNPVQSLRTLAHRPPPARRRTVEGWPSTGGASRSGPRGGAPGARHAGAGSRAGARRPCSRGRRSATGPDSKIPDGTSWRCCQGSRRSPRARPATHSGGAGSPSVPPRQDACS